MNYDITFCSKLDCNNLECKRNQRNLPEIDSIRIIWQSNFIECEHWKENNMRSKEVEEAIKTIAEQKENVEYSINAMECTPEDYDEDVYNDYKELKKKAETVLAYIEELEEKAEGKILFARGNAKTPIIAKLIEEVNKEYIDKQVIRDKIKELEEEGYWNFLEQRDLEETENILKSLLGE